MTAPLVPADADLRDFHFMPLDVARLINSDLAALATGEEFKAAVVLWCKSWHQVPAASLPNDDRMLAHLAGFGRDLKGWKRVRDMALKGFVQCDDGRLYHPVVAEKAREAVEAKRLQRERTANATAARVARKVQRDVTPRADRDEQRNENRDELRDVERNVHQETETGTGTGIGTGTVRKEERLVAVARAQGGTFEELESVLYKIPGIDAHPVATNPIIAPIWKLVQAGFDIDTQIVPSIVNRLAGAKRPIQTWDYFAKVIVDEAAEGKSPNGPRTRNHRPTAADEMRDAVASVKAHIAGRDPST